MIGQQKISNEVNKINKEWHLKNKMPKNATLKQKIKWHEGHAKNCNCRDSTTHLLKLQAINYPATEPTE